MEKQRRESASVRQGGNGMNAVAYTDLFYVCSLIEYIRRARKLRWSKFIAAHMCLKGYIDRLDTGTEDVAKLCAKSGLPAPGFTEGVDFRAVLKRMPLGGVMGGVAGGVVSRKAGMATARNVRNLPENLPDDLTKNLPETEKIIFLLLSGNTKFTPPRLASATSVTRETIRDVMKRRTGRECTTTEVITEVITEAEAEIGVKGAGTLIDALNGALIAGVILAA